MTCTCPTTDCLVHGGLKSCPFCGGNENYLEEAHGKITDSHEYWRECLDCGCVSPSKATEAAAITAWNTRAETRPTHSDKGEVCKGCEGSGKFRTGDATHIPCPYCKPSDKLEGDPLRYPPLRYPMGQLRTYKEGGGIMSYLASHIIHLYTHIDRLNAALAQPRSEK